MNIDIYCREFKERAYTQPYINTVVPLPAISDSICYHITHD